MELKDLKERDHVWLASNVCYRKSCVGLVTKVGTKWITVSDGHIEYRFDKKTMVADYSMGSPVYDLFLSQQGHTDSIVSRQDFRILKDQLDRIKCPPSEITRKAATIFGIDIDKHKQSAEPKP